MRTQEFLRLSSTVAAAALIATAGPAIAQTGATETEGDADIVVTAQRREERLQDVPATITALTGAQLDRAGINSTQQLTQVTPGLNFTQSSFSPQPIRGIGTRGVTAGMNPWSPSMLTVYISPR